MLISLNEPQIFNESTESRKKLNLAATWLYIYTVTPKVYNKQKQI